MIDSNAMTQAAKQVLETTGFATYKSEEGQDESRVIGVELTEVLIKVHVASDGLTLSEKSLIEKELKTAVAAIESKIPCSVNFRRQKPLGAGVKPAAKGPFGFTVSSRAVPNVAKVIAVSSGKGGVGKSTVTANIAVALSRMGYRVGVIDADIYGPSLPTLFGIESLPRVSGDGKLLPVTRYDIATMTFGFFVNADDPIAWRGPLVAKALEQMFFQVSWPELDVLLVDLPPGTGDVHLTILEQVKLDGVLTITTPQLLSLVDVKKGVSLYQKAGVKLLGIIENMAFFRCSNCGEIEQVFGEDLVASYAEELKVPVLAQIPLSSSIRTSGDKGTPVALNADHPMTSIYDGLARAVLDCIRI